MGRSTRLLFYLFWSLIVGCRDPGTFDNEEGIGAATSALTTANGITYPIASMSSWTNGNYGACGSSYYSGLCHIGNDVLANYGTTVYSIVAGTVIAVSGTQNPSSNCTSGWGYDYGQSNTCNMAVAVLHYDASGQPFVSVYGHLRYNSSIVVGTTFTAGQTIGVVGRYYNYNGTSISSDHLHWGIVPGDTVPSSGWGRVPCTTSQAASSTLPASCSNNGFVAPGTYITGHFPQVLPFTYDANAYTCPGPISGGVGTNWTYTCGSPQTSFTQGDTVYGLMHINNIQPNTSFRYKVSVLRNGSPSWDWTTDWYNSGQWGWDKSYFWPTSANIQPGNWVFRFWVDAGSGFWLMDTRNFAVAESLTPYHYYGGIVTCRGPVTGDQSTNWVYTCQNPTSTFNINDPATALVRIDNIGANFRWQVGIYANGTYQWGYTTDWNNVGEWGWEKAYFWPTTGSVWLSGSWEYKIYVDTGHGFQYLTSAYFSVN